MECAEDWNGTYLIENEYRIGLIDFDLSLNAAKCMYILIQQSISTLKSSPSFPSLLLPPAIAP